MEGQDARSVAQLVELNVGRATFYRTLAYYYLHELTEEQIESIASQDLEIFEDASSLISEGYADMKAYLRRVDTGTRQQLAVDYAHTFLAAGNYETFAATPYESVFTSEEGLMMQDARDEVYKMYCVEQMQPNEELRIPEDHVSFEFEFMALLIDRLNDGLAAGDFERALRYAERCRAFNADHQLNWIDDLCDAIVDVAETVFYVGVSKITRGFIHDETDVASDMEEVCRELVEAYGSAAA
ncbi:molecular chaperone TorD family protein [Slackia exigua]|uniref:TorD/DmsD family molecular chaperone n=1 Tax=Slackia exigua TaxID=84109 RepID=UPI0028ECB991|nr:molecular chaperone TorD family protein [Slackia exigua]